MTDEPKVYLTDEQWEVVRQHENTRTKEVIKHNATVQNILTDAVAIMSVANVTAKTRNEDIFNMFAASALTGLLHAGYSYSEAPPLAIKSAVAMMDALQENAR